MEEVGPPDSWEMADLEESVSRLMISTSNKNEISLGFVEEPPAVGVGAPPAERTALPSKELVSQVDQFLREALEKPRERISVLRMEQDIERFLRDPTKQQLEFQSLPTSYLRLAAHRVAQHYFLQSIAIPDNSLPDGSGSRIVLFKTAECHFPAIRLADIPVDLPQEDHGNVVKVAIKQRPQKNVPATKSMENHSSKSDHPKSVEERKEEYNRARARIFSGSSSSSVAPDDEPNLPDDLQDCSFVTLEEVKSISNIPDNNLGRQSAEPSMAIGGRTNRGRMDREPMVSRCKTGNRVAIFRDRDVDHKDPDYDRSYDRYMQRFDPGFGFNGGSFAIQPMYSPAINYNTEFPQLSSSRPQISVDNQARQVLPHMCSPWSNTILSPTTLRCGTLEGLVPSDRASRVTPQSTSSIYLHPHQYVAMPHPVMAFVRPHEHVPNFAQSPQQQPEGNFGGARPR